MFSLEELKSRKNKLKKTKTEDKTNAFLSNYESNVSFAKKYVDTFFEVNMDQYYENIKQYTPITTFIGLSKNVIKMLHAGHKKLVEELKNENLSISEENEKSFTKSRELVKSILADMKKDEEFSKLCTQIDKIITTEFKSDVFVKTSSRSPKDVTMNSKTYFTNELQKAVKAIPNDETNPLKRKFEMYKKINEIGTAFLRCSNALEVFELFIRSARVQEDFETFIFEKISTIKEFSLVIRQWDDAIDPDFEFRCYVYNQKITAVSQYNFLSPNPIIVKYEKEICELIREFFESVIREKLKKIKSYVIDFAVRNDVEMLFEKKCDAKEKMWVILIELNPFQFSTGSCMFDFKKDEEVIKGDGKQIDFRIQKNYDPKIFQKILDENVSEKYKKYFEM